MKYIDELFKIVTSPNRFAVPKPDEASNKKTDQLFLQLTTSKKEVIKKRGELKRGTVAYRKLKSRLSEQIVRKILATDPDHLMKSSFDKTYHRALRNVVLANLLYLQYSKRAANELLERNIKIARKFHFTDVAVNSLRLLRYHAAFAGKMKKFNEYSSLMNSNLKVLETELETERYSQQIILELHHSSGREIVRINNYSRMYKEIKELSAKYPSRVNILNCYRFGIHYNEYIQEHNEVIKLCVKAEKYLLANPLLAQKIRIAEFALYRMNSYLQLRDIRNGKLSAKKCDLIFEPGTDNWFIYLSYFFLLCMHTSNYSNAGDLIRQVKSHNRFNLQQQVRIEKWKIYEAYFHFILPGDKQNKFNIYKFLNEVPLHSTDKSGFNVSILIAQIISLINAGKFDDIVEKDDALKIYCQRYIRLKDNSRTYYFMKMLQVMIKYSFEPVKTEQIAQKYFNHLADSKQAGKSLEELEVIPFDVLWTVILAKLKEADREAA